MRSRFAAVFQAGSVTRTGWSSALQWRTSFSAWRIKYGIGLKSVTLVGGEGWAESNREKCLYQFVAHEREHDNDALKPSLMGFPICIFSRQTDGPCCPIYSLLSSFGGAGASPSVSASVIGTSPSRVTGTKPYDVGMIAFGVSSPA